MQTEFVRRARPLLFLLLGAFPVPASAPGAEVQPDIRPAFLDLSPDLSLALPLPSSPGLLEGQAQGPSTSRQGHLAAKTGMGFTLSPTDFLIIFQGDYFLTNNVSVGPLLQFGVDDDPFIFAPTLNFQGLFDIPDLEKLKPFVQGGLGLAYLDEDRPHRRSRDDVGFLLNVGGGVEFFLNEHISIGNNIMFNIMPVDVLGDHFFFSWQFVTVRFQF